MIGEQLRPGTPIRLFPGYHIRFVPPSRCRHFATLPLCHIKPRLSTGIALALYREDTALATFATLPLCHFATLSIFRTCTLILYNIIIIYYNNIIILVSSPSRHFLQTFATTLMWQSGKVAKWQISKKVSQNGHCKPIGKGGKYFCNELNIS